ncbi:MOSC domain-containing protein [Alphaproteobacteria bacterium]|nr:MOSC domain-containing protein [Alphaproteobacteria bacterium]
MIKIENLFYSPVKSISFTESDSLNVLEGKGIESDRVFAFVQNMDSSKIKNLIEDPKSRKLNNFITLKNTPELNKYNFTYIKDKLILKKKDEIIISINPLSDNEKKLLCEKVSQIITKDMPLDFLMDEKKPFFDTMPNNSISLINKKSISDFSNKISANIEFERFRANIYIDGLAAWEERNWIGETISINNIDFFVSDEISRCSATNLKPSTDIVTINLPNQLKKTYDHINMGLYLMPQQNGVISKDDKIIIYD